MGNGCVWASLEFDMDLSLSFQVIDGVTLQGAKQLQINK